MLKQLFIFLISFMNSSDSIPTQQHIINTSNSLQQLQSHPQQQQVANLISSIQNKLSMLACEDSSPNMSMSYRQTKYSPQREFMTATDDGKRERMHINELEESHSQQNYDLSASRSTDTKVLQRINKMEVYYMQKIQELNSKLSVLEIQNQNIYRRNSELQGKVGKLQALLELRENQQVQTIKSKIQQIKRDLIVKFANEAQNHYEEHVKETKVISEELSTEKARNKYLQQQVELLRLQKNNLQQFYKNLLDDHRNLIKLDMEKEKREIEHQPYTFHGQTIKNKQSYNSKSISNTKPKAKKKRKLEETKSQMTKDQMIPYLAKGIKDLKQKLNIK